MSQVEQENGDPEAEENPEPEEDADWTVNGNELIQGHSIETDEPEANSGLSVCSDVNLVDNASETNSNVRNCVESSNSSQSKNNSAEAHVREKSFSAEERGTFESDEGVASSGIDTKIKQLTCSESDQQFSSCQIDGESEESTDQFSNKTDANQNVAEGAPVIVNDSNQQYEAGFKESLCSSSTFSGDVQVEPGPSSDAPEDEIPSNIAASHSATSISQLPMEGVSQQHVDPTANTLVNQPLSPQDVFTNAVDTAGVELGPSLDGDKDSQTPECDRVPRGAFQSFCDISLGDTEASSHSDLSPADKESEERVVTSGEAIKTDTSSVSSSQNPSDGANLSTSTTSVSSDTGGSSSVPNNAKVMDKKEAAGSASPSASQTKSIREQLPASDSRNESSYPVAASSGQSKSSDSPISFVSSSSSTSSPDKQASNKCAPSYHHKNQSPSKEDHTPEKSISPSLSTNSAVLQLSHHSPQARKAEASAQPLSNDIERELKLVLYDDEEDDIDDIMSELDAELFSRSSDVSYHEHSSKGQSLNTKDSSMPANGILASDIRQLQHHNRQLLQQLTIRDEEIGSLTKEKDSIKSELSLTQSERDDLWKKLSTSSNHNADDIYIPQIKELEKTIAQQENEIRLTREKLSSHDNAAKRAVTTLQNELKCRVDQVTKLYEEAVKEKDAIVIRFAASESKAMENKKLMEKQEARMKEALRDREHFGNALKAAKADRHKAITNLEMKSNEVANIHKELEKMKEAVSSSDYRIKWFQNKLKEELEVHKETKATLEKTVSKLKEAKEETEIIRGECQAIVKTYQESEEIKSNSLDKELKIKESQLKLQKQEFSDTEEIQRKTKKELESIKVQYKDTLEELKSLQKKVTSLEETVAEKDMALGHTEEMLKKQKNAKAEMQDKISASENLAEDFSRAQDMIKSLDKDVADLKITNLDLQRDMESCRERESKMLALQSELSRTNALLRSENTNLSNKASNLTADVERLKMEVQELETTVKHLTDSYEEGRKKKLEEMVVLKASLDEKTKESSEYKQKWEDEMDSNKTLKRRHANNVKDLTRQLMQAKRKLENVEGSKDGGSMGSRTNSNGSLNSVDNSSSHNPPTQANPQQEFPVITEQVEVDKHVLIERIVRLQKSHARKNEKLEFLSEHIHQLLEEIKKKNKIIQSYILREEAGTLSSEDMDANKAEAQKEMQTLLARKGGIMASLYSLHQQDGHMTMELSLQINKKLQAVLEDTLLKNITLKENLDTLGEEIARLSQQNRKLQLHLHDLEAASAEGKVMS